MASWQRKILLGDVWESDNIQLISRTIADRLAALPRIWGFDRVEQERERLVSEFSILVDDADATTYDFDVAMEELYDWGDTSLDDKLNGKKVCWISTMEKP